jgi:serine/threonine protein kinase
VSEMATMEELPARIGRYAVARRLGSGGMGEVYLAYSPAGSPVAVKLIRRDRLDPHTRARFEREALIARTVVGTNRVARFLEADPYADRPWLAMEYVPGRTLLDFVSGEGPLPLPLVASLGALLAEGLEAVHSVNLLHRDLKPQNIMLGAEGPMIIDFGLGAFMDSSQDSLTTSGAIIGTVRCMPPEQASGAGQVTKAADVYSLGTVLLYAATGHYPYDGARWEAIVAQVVNREVAPDLTGVPPRFQPLLTAMLAHDPDSRPVVEGVAESCAQLLQGIGANPADARLALIVRTVVGPAGAPAEHPSPSLEKLLRDWLSVDRGSQAGPLDGGPGSEGPEVGVVEEPEPTRPAGGDHGGAREEPPGGDDARGRRATASRGTRVVASRRVAAELRARYAVQPAL